MNQPCQHFPSCGGCSLRDISYEEQLQQKQSVVNALFHPLHVNPIMPCEEKEHYRNKMEFSFSQNKKGDRFLGLILKQSRGKVFNLQECLIGPTGCVDLLEKVRKWWEKTDLPAFNFRSGLGALRTLTVRKSARNSQCMVMLTVSGDPAFALSQKDLDQFVEAIDDPAISIFLQIHQAVKGRPTQFFEMHLSGPSHIIDTLHLNGKSFQFKISPTSFFQPNTRQAEKLYQAALSLPQLQSDACVYDLYCGTGTLGIVCAPFVKQVIGIELNPHAVFDGKMNAEDNQVSNINFYQGDVAHVLQTQPLARPDIVIIDPPRSGLDVKAISQIMSLSPQEILYISCNPATQAANIQMLTDYEVRVIQPVDQFPHTSHIENICLLSKR